MQKDSFLQFFANLPINVRDEVILVLDNVGPITWKVAYREISAETPLGKTIYDKLVEFKFIPVKNE
jgi:hypothetical protein